MIRIVLPPLALLLGAAALFAQDKRDPDRTEVLNILADQVHAWNQGDLQAFMNGYWNSPQLSFYSGRDKRAGWRETYERFRQRYQAEGKEMGKLAFTELEATPLSADVMMVRGRWKLDLKAELIDGLFTLIMARKPEGWRIVHDHTSAGEPVRKP